MQQLQDSHCSLGPCGGAIQRFRLCSVTQVLSSGVAHLQKCLANSLDFTSPFHIQQLTALFILSHNSFARFSDLDPRSGSVSSKFQTLKLLPRRSALHLSRLLTRFKDLIARSLTNQPYFVL